MRLCLLKNVLSFDQIILMRTRASHFLLALAVIFPSVAFAQTLGLMDGSSSDAIAPRGGSGWAEWNDRRELVAFLIDALVTLVLAALIAHHPIRRQDPPTLQSVTLPRLFYLYALIGMAVGFLVLNHGAVIGFVVFGIGALLRFRSNMDDPLDTVEIILVTVLGLCVGMDLPVMAVLIGAVAWVVILVVSRNAHFLLTLRAEDNGQVDTALAVAEEKARQNGWRILRSSRSHAKPAAEMLVSMPRGLAMADAENAFAPELDGAGVNWKIES